MKKRSDKSINKKNTKKNLIRTKLLIIANEEFKVIRKSKMLLNSYSPEELIKIYEQNYRIEFKQQESPMKSLTSKKRAFHIGAIIDKSVSFVDEASICGQRRRSITDLKKISLAERKFGNQGLKQNSILEKRSSSFLNESYASNYNSKANRFTTSIKNNIACEKILTTIETETKKIQTSFDYIQQFCAKIIKSADVQKKPTDNKFDENLFEMLDFKAVNYDKKMTTNKPVIPFNKTAKPPTNIIKKNTNDTNTQKNKFDIPKSIFFKPNDDMIDNNSLHHQDSSQKSGKVKSATQSQRNNDESYPKKDGSETNSKECLSALESTLMANSQKKQEIKKVCIKKNRRRSSLISEVDEGEGENDHIYSKNDYNGYSNNIEEIDIMNNSSSQISVDQTNDLNYREFDSNNIDGLLRRLSNYGSSYGTGTGGVLDFNSNNLFSNAKANCPFGDPVAHFSSNMSSSNDKLGEVSFNTNTLNIDALDHHNGKELDYDTGNIALEDIEQFKKKIEEENLNKELKEYDSNEQELYKSIVSDHSSLIFGSNI